MPEGPEVLYMVKNLNEKYKNLILKELNIISGRYKTHGLPNNYNLFITQLPSKIIKFYCKGKLIWLELENNLSMVITLGYAYFTKNMDDNTSIQFVTNKKIFYLKDIRHFATIKFLDKYDLKNLLGSRGPSIVNSELTENKFIDIIRNVKKKDQFIGTILLNQYLISGIGNYIRADSLYLAKLSPFREIKNLKLKELKNLYKSLKLIINESLLAKSKNKFYEFKVYRQNEIDGFNISKDNLSGRSIYWVPSIQK